MPKEIEIRECNWISNNKNKSIDAFVKLRNTSEPIPAKIKINFDEKTSNVLFDHPQYGISPGQAAEVFYDKNDLTHVFGGGWINKTYMPNVESKNELQN